MKNNIQINKNNNYTKGVYRALCGVCTADVRASKSNKKGNKIKTTYNI